MSRRLIVRAAWVAMMAALAVPAPAWAQSCTRADFDKAVDEAGQSLRQINTAGMPEIESRLAEIRERNGWSDEEARTHTAALMQDAQIEELDRQAYDLYAQIDAITTSDPGAQPDCAQLDALRAHVLELSATMRAKVAYMEKKLDAVARGGEPSLTLPVEELAAADQQQDEEEISAAPGPSAGSGVAEPGADPARTGATGSGSGTGWSTGGDVAILTEPLPNLTPDIGTGNGVDSGWSTSTETEPYVEAVLPEGAQSPDDLTFSAGEILDAGSGLFGTISGGLASVFAYAFQTLGRPNGYVLGEEGGGAFLAGVRYGKGRLVMKDGTKLTVYWHGPSIGYDLGASGGRVMFLIYNLPGADALFRSYTGVDGSAYLVGGAGITVLTNGETVLAPVRSGIGLRLGASAGYIRFTRHATWNPF